MPREKKKLPIADRFGADRGYREHENITRDYSLGVMAPLR